MLVFTKDGAKRIHEDFNKMCKQFAIEHNVEFDTAHLTYGEQLSFSAKFSIKENKNDAWENMVSYVKRTYNKDLIMGLRFIDRRTNYVLTGMLNPNTASKFKIGARNVLTGNDTYFTVEYLATLL